jgi:hypothetical protein
VPSQNVKVSLQCAVDVFGTITNVCELPKKIQNLSVLRGFSIRLQEWPVEIVIEIGGHSVSGSYCTSSDLILLYAKSLNNERIGNSLSYQTPANPISGLVWECRCTI